VKTLPAGFVVAFAPPLPRAQMEASLAILLAGSDAAYTAKNGCCRQSLATKVAEHMAALKEAASAMDFFATYGRAWQTLLK